MAIASYQIVRPLRSSPGYRHCVISLSLTVSDASALGKRIELIPIYLTDMRPTLLVVPASVPYAGAVPDGGLVRL